MKIFTFDIEKYSNSNWRCRGHLAIVLAAAIYEKKIAKITTINVIFTAITTASNS